MSTITLRAYLEELNALLEQEALEEVIGHCRHILQYYPKNLETYRLLGKALLEKARFDEALEIFPRLLSADPSDFVAHVGLSAVYEQQDEVGRALWHMERAFEQAPNNALVADEIRRLYERLGHPPPDKIKMTRGALAKQYVTNQMYDQAINELRAALAEQPQRLDLKVLLADTLWQANYPVEAGETALEVLQILPDCLVANQLMARLWLHSRRPEDAQPFLKRVEALAPYDSLQLVYQANNRQAEVPDSAFALERLDWSAAAMSAAAGDAPDWVGKISDVFDVADDVALTGAESLPGEEEPALAGEDIPDWLAKGDQGGAETAPSDDLPDWFSGGADLGDKPQTGDLSAPEDWFSEMSTEVSQTGPLAEPDVDEAPPEPEPAAEGGDGPTGFTGLLDEVDDDLSDDLSNLRAAAAPPSEDEVAALIASARGEDDEQPDDAPDWLSDTEEPDWGAEEPVELDDDFGADWLSDEVPQAEADDDFATMFEAGDDQAGDAPDWLSDEAPAQPADDDELAALFDEAADDDLAAEDALTFGTTELGEDDLATMFGDDAAEAVPAPDDDDLGALFDDDFDDAAAAELDLDDDFDTALPAAEEPVPSAQEITFEDEDEADREFATLFDDDDELDDEAAAELDLDDDFDTVLPAAEEPVPSAQEITFEDEDEADREFATLFDDDDELDDEWLTGAADDDFTFTAPAQEQEQTPAEAGEPDFEDFLAEEDDQPAPAQAPDFEPDFEAALDDEADELDTSWLEASAADASPVADDVDDEELADLFAGEDIGADTSWLDPGALAAQDQDQAPADMDDEGLPLPQTGDFFDDDLDEPSEDDLATLFAEEDVGADTSWLGDAPQAEQDEQPEDDFAFAAGEEAGDLGEPSDDELADLFAGEDIGADTSWLGDAPQAEYDDQPEDDFALAAEDDDFDDDWLGEAEIEDLTTEDMDDLDSVLASQAGDDEALDVSDDELEAMFGVDEAPPQAVDDNLAADDELAALLEGEDVQRTLEAAEDIAAEDVSDEELPEWLTGAAEAEAAEAAEAEAAESLDTGFLNAALESAADDVLAEEGLGEDDFASLFEDEEEVSDTGFLRALEDEEPVPAEALAEDDMDFLADLEAEAAPADDEPDEFDFEAVLDAEDAFEDEWDAGDLAGEEALALEDEGEAELDLDSLFEEEMAAEALDEQAAPAVYDEAPEDEVTAEELAGIFGEDEALPDTSEIDDLFDEVDAQQAAAAQAQDEFPDVADFFDEDFDFEDEAIAEEEFDEDFEAVLAAEAAREEDADLDDLFAEDEAADEAAWEEDWEEPAWDEEAAPTLAADDEGMFGDDDQLFETITSGGDTTRVIEDAELTPEIDWVSGVADDEDPFHEMEEDFETALEEHQARDERPTALPEDMRARQPTFSMADYPYIFEREPRWLQTITTEAQQSQAQSAPPASVTEAETDWELDDDFMLDDDDTLLLDDDLDIEAELEAELDDLLELDDDELDDDFDWLE